jgi:hypothetical protein
MRLLLLSREAEWRFIGWWSPEKFKGGRFSVRHGNASTRSEGKVEWTWV